MKPNSGKYKIKFKINQTNNQSDANMVIIGIVLDLMIILHGHHGITKVKIIKMFQMVLMIINLIIYLFYQDLNTLVIIIHT